MFGVCSSLSLLLFFFLSFSTVKLSRQWRIQSCGCDACELYVWLCAHNNFFSFSSSLLYRFLRGNSIKPNCSRFCAIHVYIYNTLSGFFIFYIFFLLAFGASFAVALQTATASNSVWCLCIRIMKYAKVLAHCFAGILLHLKNLSWLWVTMATSGDYTWTIFFLAQQEISSTVNIFI